MNNYIHYFQKHFNISVSGDDIVMYRKWFLSQWNFIHKKISLKKTARVLEIGSGIGIFYSFLKTIIRDSNYEGLEMDKHACSFTNQFFKTNIFQNVSFEDYKDSSKFDSIFAFEVLEHIEDPVFAIQKINTLLTKDGFFVGTSPFPYRKNVYADETHRYVLHPSNWKKLFIENGFTTVETYPMSFFPFLWRMSPVLNIRIPFYVPFPYFISTTLIVAQK